MKKIYINRTKHAICFGSTMLLPGSNVAEEIDEKKFPSIKVHIEADNIEVSEDPASAVRDANTQQAVNDLANMDPKNEALQKNAGKRKGVLDKLDEQAKAAVAKKAKQEAEENGESEEGEGE